MIIIFIMLKVRNISIHNAQNCPNWTSYDAADKISKDIDANNVNETKNN